MQVLQTTLQEKKIKKKIKDMDKNKLQQYKNIFALKGRFEQL